MAFPFNINRDTLVTIDGRQARFHCELPGDRVQFHDSETFLAINLSADDFRTKFLDGSLRFLSLRSVPIELRNGVELTLDHFPEQALPDMRRRKEYLDAIDCAGDPKTPLLIAIINEVAKRRNETPPHYKTVVKWTKSRGTTGHRSLVQMRTRNDRKGGHSTLTDHQNRIITEAIESTFLDSRQLPVDDVWATIVNAIAQLNKQLPQAFYIKYPSKATVYRRVRKYRDYKTTRMRQGAKAASKVFRWVGVAPETETINELWVADATILDTIVVLDPVNMIILGKPTLTIVLDAHTRCLGGWYVGFEPPSHLSLGLALRHAIAPKSPTELADPNGRRRTFAEGVPQNLLLDNALENKSPSMKDALGTMGINPVFAPVKDPEYKGIAERFFRTLNTKLIHKLPGATRIGSKRKTDLGIDPIKDAVITVEFLNELIIETVADIYHVGFHTGINMAPEDKWKRGAQETRIELPASMDSLNVLLGRITLRTLTRKGIVFQKLLYGSNEVTTLLNQLLPLSNEPNPKGVKVKIKYDPGDLGSIWVLNPISGEYVTFPCLRRKYANGLTLHHHLQILAHARLTHRALHSEEDLCVAKVALREKIEAAFGQKLMREKKRAARIKTVQNKRLIGDVLQVYDEVASSLSTLDQTVEETEFMPDGTPLPDGTLMAAEPIAATDGIPRDACGPEKPAAEQSIGRPSIAHRRPRSNNQIKSSACPSGKATESGDVPVCSAPELEPTARDVTASIPAPPPAANSAASSAWIRR